MNPMFTACNITNCSHRLSTNHHPACHHHDHNPQDHDHNYVDPEDHEPDVRRVQHHQRLPVNPTSGEHHSQVKIIITIIFQVRIIKVIMTTIVIYRFYNAA